MNVNFTHITRNESNSVKLIDIKISMEIKIEDFEVFFRQEEFWLRN